MSSSPEIKLLLCGDVMLGRGIDQILPHPNNPAINERWRDIYDAREFIERAENKNGPLPQHRPPGYVWGDTLEIFDGLAADLRLINLETAVTSFNHPWPGKPVHFRMHPDNIGVLQQARIDCCALANNHVLDWGHPGLRQTLYTLSQNGVRYAGAGNNAEQAATPVSLELGDKGRVWFVAAATESSGVPREWAAQARIPGVNLITLDDDGLAKIARGLQARQQTSEITVVSIHWGGNYDPQIDERQQSFARRLIDDLDVNIVHGHSSHHVRAIEMYKDRLILYGCGDLINDYEGIPVHEKHRPLLRHLGLVYLARVNTESGALLGLHMVPTKMNRLQVQRANSSETRDLCTMLNEHSAALGMQIVARNGSLALQLR